MESVEIKETFEETVTIAGTTQSVQSVAITAERRVKGIPQTQTDTYHEIKVGDSWQFLAIHRVRRSRNRRWNLLDRRTLRACSAVPRWRGFRSTAAVRFRGPSSYS